MTQALHPAVTIAQTLYAANDLDGAWRTLTGALQGEPTHRGLLRMRAHLALAMKKPDLAEADMDQVLTLYPDDADSHDDRGVLYQRRGDFQRAANCHLRSVELSPSDGALLNLAISINHMGDTNLAQKLYNDVLALNPKNTRAMINLAVILMDGRDVTLAEQLLKAAADLGDNSFELCMACGNLCRQAGRRDEAAQWYDNAVAKRPDNKPARFMLALVRGENPDAPPPEHVADLFNSYASHFDQSLVDVLKYRAPDLLMRALEHPLNDLKTEHADLTAIDLGAGTGLMGKLLRPHVARSTGLDISANMLQKAQKQNIYDDIECTDIERGLVGRKNHFHLITAADVFVYIGKLDSLFTLCNDALKDGGLLAFSTEAMTHDEKGDFVLRDTGRYAHDERYIRILAEKNGFAILTLDRTWLRYNKDKPLDGFVCVFKKK